MCLSRSGFSEAEARARSCGAESMAETFGYFMLHVYTILAPALGFGEARATGPDHAGRVKREASKQET